MYDYLIIVSLFFFLSLKFKSLSFDINSVLKTDAFIKTIEMH
jgi:hypothetical protein